MLFIIIVKYNSVNQLIYCLYCVPIAYVVYDIILYCMIIKYLFSYLDYVVYGVYRHRIIFKVK